MWFPPLPDKRKVKVVVGITPELYYKTYYLDHYRTLNIEPFVEHNGNKRYLTYILVNGEDIICTPKLYLDKYINTVELGYYEIRPEDIGLVYEDDGVISFKDYLPQIGGLFFEYSFPRTSIYKGIKFEQENLDADILAFPVDLDKEDFEVWRNGIKFTLHLNRDNKVEEDGVAYSLFDIIKAEFYGKLLPLEKIDDYIELKPKGE